MTSALWNGRVSVLLVALWLAAVACSDSGAGSPGGRGGSAGDGSSGASGQAGSAGEAGGAPVGGQSGADAGGEGGAGGAGTGGSGGMTGGSGGMSSPDGGMCIPHTGNPVVDPSVLDACGECGAAHCLPSGFLTAEQASMLADCPTGGDKCVPDLLIETGGMFLLEVCESLAGVEGRCLSTCVPQVSEQAARLPKDVCEDGELCAPCFDPITGLATGACSQSCDPGPAEEPLVFAGCCDNGADENIGSCVPLALVPEDQRTLLGQDSCEGTDLCAPVTIAAGAYQPVECEGPGGAEARCLAACLPDIAAQADRLVRGSCAQGELCAPCYDPLTGASTGACELEGDQPEEPPYVFPTCCDDGAGMDLGTCVPTTSVPAEQVELLGEDSCDEGMLCAPTPLVTASYAADACESIAGAEGRCLPACLPSVASQADRLPQADCAQGELCAPCFDPITGDNTGACNLEDDEPEEQPVSFPTCCDDGMGEDLGTCVPNAFVPAEQASLLGQDTCAAGNLCAPTPIAAGTYQPQTCASWGASEGRCLPSCLPDIAAQAAQLRQDICDQGELCAPCFDPLTGDSTGSCELEGDEPGDPAYEFPTCCDNGMGTDLGTCVPTALVSSEQASLLGRDSCASGNLCAPTELANSAYTPMSCDSWGGGEGRCLPSCLPDIAVQADRLTRGACAQGELCAPCFDPVTGVATGSCAIEGDMPAEPAYTFPTCCSSGAAGNLGTCVPSALVSSEQAELLGQNTCAMGNLCAPTTIARGEYVPDVCSSWLGAEGRCLLACLPDVAAQASKLQDPATDDCDQGELCVPCFDPVTGASTGACELEGDEPANDTPETFPACCPTPSPNGAQRGTCVPARAAGAQASSLPNLNCETLTSDADDYVCAPDEKVETPIRNFPTCTTQYTGPACGGVDLALLCTIRNTAFNGIDGKGGVCVPACFLSEQGTTNIPTYGDYSPNQLYGQSTCAAGVECAPCVYPDGHANAGQATGLCP